MSESLQILQKKTFTNILEGLMLQTSIKLDLDSGTSAVNKQPRVNRPSRQRYSFVNYQSIKNVAQNEKKALKVLIIIFSVFVTLWSPYFVINMLNVLCEKCTNVLLSNYESLVYSVLTWLGYLSSMANPIVYTMFNKSFRTAFINILKCKKVSLDTPNKMSFRQPNLNGQKSQMVDIDYLNPSNNIRLKSLNSSSPNSSFNYFRKSSANQRV